MLLIFYTLPVDILPFETSIKNISDDRYHIFIKIRQSCYMPRNCKRIPFFLFLIFTNTKNLLVLYQFKSSIHITAKLSIY